MVHNIKSLPILADRYSCTGCLACVDTCPVGALKTIIDEEGFLTYSLNVKVCISCHKCESNCPIVSEYKYGENVVRSNIYAAWNLCDAERMQSASGGAFSAIASYFLSQSNTCVIGATQDGIKTRHIAITQKKDLYKIQGSKYAQSDTTGIYKLTYDKLKAGVKVLFSGTPCQVAGLKLFLRKSYDNLYTVDLICHGVPSPKIFQDYLEFVKGKKLISHINMKSKSNKKGTAIRIDFTNGKYIRQTLKTDLWNKLYFNHYIVRPSCHDCQFTHYNRVGDITIGDSWGINKYYPNFYSDKMTSLLLVNNSKGNFLYEKISERMDKIEITKEESWQPQLQYPMDESIERENFWKDYIKYGFYYIVKKYIGYTFFERIKFQIKRFYLYMK